MKDIIGGVEIDLSPERIAEQAARADAWANRTPEEWENPRPEPAIYAVAQLAVANGDITGIDVASKFSAAIYLDIGSYLAFFADTLPDAQYIARGDSASATIRVTERSTDYIAISAVDAAGQPVDPAEFSIEIVRVI